MNSVLLGVIAALAWGLHDLLIRYVSRSLGNVQAVLIVLIFGAISIAGAMLLLGEPVELVTADTWLLALLGVAYAVAFVSLFLAFEIGPVSLVSPIVGAYPVLVMMWAIANGAQPSLADWLAVASIVSGVALVARFAGEPPADPSRAPAGTRASAIVYSLFACAGFAFALTGNQIAAHDGGELNVTLIGRLWSLAVMAAWCLKDRGSLAGAKPWLPVLMLMGMLDAGALVAVTSAGQQEGAEFAIVIASCFGAVTVLLAVIFLKERINLPQLLGMLMILAGVIELSSRY